MISLTISSNNNHYIIGIDIGGTNLRIGGVSSNNQLIDKPKRYSSRTLFDTDQPELILCELIAQFIEDYPHWTLKGICLGFPGTVNLSKDTVISCPNLLAFTNRNIAKPLQSKFHVPVIAEHDVLLLLSYDMEFLQIEDADCITSFYIGTGLGNGIYIHGRFLDGKNGVAGELGHIPLYSKKDMCSCGNQGCIELYSCGKALEGIHTKHLPEIEFVEIFSHYNEYPVLKEYIEYMAIAIATEINILDPNYIILSGGVIHMKNFPLNDLYKNIHKYARKPYPEKALTFLLGSTEPFAGILGAGVYMWKKINK